MNIKVQFSHFLKLTNFIQHIGKILNQSVNEVHYIFKENQMTEQSQLLFKDIGDALQSLEHHQNTPRPKREIEGTLQSGESPRQFEMARDFE